MKVIAKCHNYSGCLHAYRGDQIELESGAALVCPECGKALVIDKSSSAWVRTTLYLSLAVVLAGAVAAGFVYWKNGGLHGPGKPPITEPSSTDTPNTEPGPKSDPTPATPKPTVSTPPQTQIEPPNANIPIVAPAHVDLDATKGENKSVKDEVLTRIDLMPNITTGNKDKLYHSVERARQMGKVLIIPFASGQSTLSQADQQSLKTALESPVVMKLRDDPTAVFVILGYADSKGDEKKNLSVSQSRADSALSVMKNKCGVQNVMHAVAMGSSKLLDAQSLEKNRIVEVWAVLP